MMKLATAPASPPTPRASARNAPSRARAAPKVDSRRKATVPGVPTRAALSSRDSHLCGVYARGPADMPPARTSARAPPERVELERVLSAMRSCAPSAASAESRRPARDRRPRGRRAHAHPLRQGHDHKGARRGLIPRGAGGMAVCVWQAPLGRGRRRVPALRCADPGPADYPEAED